MFLDNFQSVLFLSKVLKEWRYIYRNSHSEVPKEDSQVIANIWIPKPGTHILLLTRGSDKHQQRGNFWASIHPTGSGWDGGCRKTSLRISAAEAGKEAAVTGTWRHLWDLEKERKFLQRPTFAAPFCSRLLHFKVVPHIRAMILDPDYIQNTTTKEVGI